MQHPELGPVIPGSGAFGNYGGPPLVAVSAGATASSTACGGPNVAENIPPHVLRQIAKEVEDV
jgi:hypothetical protein